jgi:hypothetical protein
VYAGKAAVSPPDRSAYRPDDHRIAHTADVTPADIVGPCS